MATAKATKAPSKKALKALLGRIGDRRVVHSISTGKDSVAADLYLTELGIDHDRIFLDTRWEHPAVAKHLEYLREKLGPITALSGPLSMVDLIRKKGMFPSRARRFCTEELKTFPARDYLNARIDAGDDVINSVGIRRDESEARANMTEWEWMDGFDCEVWRPLVTWSIDDVIAIHKRHDVKPNGLYLLGLSRVGCWPCINSNKGEVRMIADLTPEKIDELRDLEAEIAVKAKARYDKRLAKYQAGGLEAHPRVGARERRQPAAPHRALRLRRGARDATDLGDGRVALDLGRSEPRARAHLVFAALPPHIQPNRPVRYHLKGPDHMATAAQSVITRRTVPLSELLLEAPHWTNPREFTGLDDKAIEEMGESIKTKGLNDPPKVQQIKVNGDIKNLVIDGQRRVLGALLVLPKNAPIPVVDVWEDPIELTVEKADELLMKALTSLQHEGLSSYELSSIAERMKKRGKTGEKIATYINKSPSWVSRFLKARSTASPKLMLQWRKGEITDEQFKDLAEVRDPEEQVRHTKEVVEARKSGDKAEARVRVKEIKEAERKTRPAPAPKAKPGKDGKPAHPPKAVTGEQVDMFADKSSKGAAPAPTSQPAPKRTAPSKLVLEELVAMSDKRAPVEDYVKGIMDGVRFALGKIDAEGFAKPWVKYLSRIEGRPKPAKKVKPAKKAAKAKAAPKAKRGKVTKKAKGGKRK